jgi:hypothetical protein
MDQQSSTEADGLSASDGVRPRANRGSEAPSSQSTPDPDRTLRFQSGCADTVPVTGVAVRGIDAEGTSQVISVHLPGHHGPHLDRAGLRRAAA